MKEQLVVALTMGINYAVFMINHIIYPSFYKKTFIYLKLLSKFKEEVSFCLKFYF